MNKRNIVSAWKYYRGGYSLTALEAFQCAKEQMTDVGGRVKYDSIYDCIYTEACIEEYEKIHDL